MSVDYDATIKNLRMDATRGGVANGTLEIQDASNNVLVTYGLDATAGSVTGAVWTLGFDATTVAATASGTASKAQIKNSGGTARITGLTVTLSGGGGNVIIDNTSITATQDITTTGATITHAA